jgi:hypothetical protein
MCPVFLGLKATKKVGDDEKLEKQKLLCKESARWQKTPNCRSLFKVQSEFATLRIQRIVTKE